MKTEHLEAIAIGAGALATCALIALYFLNKSDRNFTGVYHEVYDTKKGDLKSVNDAEFKKYGDRYEHLDTIVVEGETIK